MAGQKIQINLLPISSFEKSTVGKIISWALTIGRYIIIATELIVIIAFLSRFKLDSDLADLNEAIKEKQAILKSFGKVETEFRSLQERLEAIKKLEAEQLPTSKLLETLSQLTPADIYFKNLSLKANVLSIEAVALSDASLSTFLSSMQKNNQFEEINLTSLTSEGSGSPEIKFALKVSLKKS